MHDAPIIGLAPVNLRHALAPALRFAIAVESHRLVFEQHQHQQVARSIMGEQLDLCLLYTSRCV